MSGQEGIIIKRTREESTSEAGIAEEGTDGKRAEDEILLEEYHKAEHEKKHSKEEDSGILECFAEIQVEALPAHIQTGGVYTILQPNPNSYTHIYFKYPCRFIPEIPRWAIRRYLNPGEKKLIFDPFSGSGTTLLEAVLNGYDSMGTEIDDVAKLITKVKSTSFSGQQLEQMKEIYHRLLLGMTDTRVIPFRPPINNLEHWFTEKALTCLGRLAAEIGRIPDINIRDFFRVCFGSIIKKVSNADDVSPKPYVSKNVPKTPADPVREFQNTWKRYYEAAAELSALKLTSSAVIIEGDALTFQPDQRFHLAVTSPPYINAFDYGRTMRLENLWLGMLSEEQLRAKKREYVGTENIVAAKEEENTIILNDSVLLQNYYKAIYETDRKRALIVKKFFEDMKTNLLCVYRNLVSGGCYVVVIGNSSIRGVEVESWRVIEEIAHKIGYETDTYFSYVIQNPYIRIPRGGKGGKINKDYVISLIKRN